MRVCVFEREEEEEEDFQNNLYQSLLRNGRAFFELRNDMHGGEGVFIVTGTRLSPRDITRSYPCMHVCVCMCIYTGKVVAGFEKGRDSPEMRARLANLLHALGTRGLVSHADALSSQIKASSSTITAQVCPPDA